ncbi:hypothetical protein ACQPTN_05545 [Bradyrhizobium sp. 13971]
MKVTVLLARTPRAASATSAPDDHLQPGPSQTARPGSGWSRNVNVAGQLAIPLDQRPSDITEYECPLRPPTDRDRSLRHCWTSSCPEQGRTFIAIQSAMRTLRACPTNLGFRAAFAINNADILSQRKAYPPRVR